MKDILKEFDERILSDVGMNSLQIREFISKAIDQTREETIKEAKREIKKYISSKKKILHFNRVIAGEEILDILNKLKK